MEDIKVIAKTELIQIRVTPETKDYYESAQGLHKYLKRKKRIVRPSIGDKIAELIKKEALELEKETGIKPTR